MGEDSASPRSTELAHLRTLTLFAMRWSADR